MQGVHEEVNLLQVHKLRRSSAIFHIENKHTSESRSNFIVKYHEERQSRDLFQSFSQEEVQIPKPLIT
jgi:hypothetical protein